jgi:hypothetical protein
MFAKTLHLFTSGTFPRVLVHRNLHYAFTPRGKTRPGTRIGRAGATREDGTMSDFVFRVEQTAEHIDEIARRLSWGYCAKWLDDHESIVVFDWFGKEYREQTDEDTSEVIDTLPEGPAIRELVGKLKVAKHFTHEQRHREREELGRVHDELIMSLVRGPDIAEMTVKYDAEMVEAQKLWAEEQARLQAKIDADRKASGWVKPDWMS